MRTTRRLLLLASLLLCAGCAAWHTPVVPPRGLLYTDYSAPLTMAFDDTPVGGKTGTASTFFLGVPFVFRRAFAWDDASVQKAAEAGGLSRVDYADYHILSVLGVFGKFTIIAHGD